MAMKELEDKIVQLIKEQKFDEDGTRNESGSKTIKKLYNEKDKSEETMAAFENAKSALIQMCHVEVDQCEEALKAEKYSEEVKTLRGKRTIKEMEEGVRELEATVEVLQLKIDEENAKIEEQRSSDNAAA